MVIANCVFSPTYILGYYSSSGPKTEWITSINHVRNVKAYLAHTCILYIKWCISIND